MKYKIIIQEVQPFDVTTTKYECEDGKAYDSKYSVPDGMKYKVVAHKTGEVAFTHKEIYTQEKDDIELVEVIKAINQIK